MKNLKNASKEDRDAVYFSLSTIYALSGDVECKESAKIALALGEHLGMTELETALTRCVYGMMCFTTASDNAYVVMPIYKVIDMAKTISKQLDKEMTYEEAREVIKESPEIKSLIEQGVDFDNDVQTIETSWGKYLYIMTPEIPKLRETVYGLDYADEIEEFQLHNK